MNQNEKFPGSIPNEHLKKLSTRVDIILSSKGHTFNQGNINFLRQKHKNWTIWVWLGRFKNLMTRAVGIAIHSDSWDSQFKSSHQLILFTIICSEPIQNYKTMLVYKQKFTLKVSIVLNLDCLLFENLEGKFRFRFP